MENKEGLCLDFLEIGSCDFDSMAESITDDQHGMIVEPLTVYLSNISNHKNLTKVNAAIMFDDGEIPIYYIEPKDIEEHGLHEFMRGCNKIGEPHDLHVDYFDTVAEIDVWQSYWKRPGAPKGRNLVNEGIVNTKNVPCMKFSTLFNKYNIKEIKLLKLDTEGFDAELLQSFLDTLCDFNIRLPETILFETNCHNPHELVFEVIKRLSHIGYYIEVGEATSNTWSVYTNTIYRDCKATIRYKVL